MPDICRRMSPICDGYGRPTKPKYLQLPTEVASRVWKLWLMFVLRVIESYTLRLAYYS